MVIHMLLTSVNSNFCNVLNQDLWYAYHQWYAKVFQVVHE